MASEPVPPEIDDRVPSFELPNGDYVGLEDDAQDRLIEYNQSVQAVENAKGRRILYERAPPETLPFIVYSLYVSGNGLAALFVLFSFDGTMWPFFLIIGIAMVTPLLVLPTGSFSNVYSWLVEYLKFWQRD